MINDICMHLLACDCGMCDAAVWRWRPAKQNRPFAFAVFPPNRHSPPQAANSTRARHPRGNSGRTHQLTPLRASPPLSATVTPAQSRALVRSWLVKAAAAARERLLPLRHPRSCHVTSTRICACLPLPGLCERLATTLCLTVLACACLLLRDVALLLQNDNFFEWVEGLKLQKDPVWLDARFGVVARQ